MANERPFGLDDKYGGREPPRLPPGVKLRSVLSGHQDTVHRIGFDCTGRRVASGSSDRTVRIWDACTGDLLRTIEGYSGPVWCVAFDVEGRTLACASDDGTVTLWDPSNGELLHTLKGHHQAVYDLAFAPRGGELASSGGDGKVKLWHIATGRLLRTLDHYPGGIASIAIDSAGRTLVSGGDDGKVRLWDLRTGDLLHSLVGHRSLVRSVAFHPMSPVVASASWDNTVNLWDGENGQLLHTLEGHNRAVFQATFSTDGRFLASKSDDNTVRLWRCDTWESIAVVRSPVDPYLWFQGLAFHPTKPILATVSSVLEASRAREDRLIYLWELDPVILLADATRTGTPRQSVHHVTAKIVLVGDHSVGKSALGHRMIHGEFKEQASTHGQQFWVFPELGKQRADGTECEAILWDFAGQPDYRLVHALFVDDADLALVLFDASDIRDPLHGVEFWLKQLQTGGKSCPIVLVAAQTDRGSCPLTDDELTAFCDKHGIVGPIHTSALNGEGVQELIERMKKVIPWEDKPATVTTATFKRIKDYVLDLKGMEGGRQSIVTPEELRGLLEATDAEWEFTNAEMLTAVGHLENYGYVKTLRTSKGEERILLAPELLNNLASSFVLEARRSPRGLGSLEESRLLSGGYAFPELSTLSEDERDVLLDAAELLFLEHNVCFRETDPLRMKSYLVFPELINLRKPIDDDRATEDGMAYTVSGPTENVFASLVVLLGYTQTFRRTKQWRNNARYEVGEGLMCGFRQESERDGELDLVLCFCPEVGPPVRTLFQGLFESFLARRNLTVMRYEPVVCSKGHSLNRNVVRESLQHGDDVAFCSKCGEKLMLPKIAEPIQLAREVEAEVAVQRRTAEQRTRFEQAVFCVRSYVTEQGIEPLGCFISYAWGEAQHERWVEKSLATDLQKAGINVLLDRWHNPPGSSVGRFVDRIEKCDRIVPVGTKLYRAKYENRGTEKGTVVAAECDQIGVRMRGTQKQKRTVVPVLLEGDIGESLPPCLHDQVYCDFRKEQEYFVMAFDLILSLYEIEPRNPAVADLRQSLQPREGL